MSAMPSLPPPGTTYEWIPEIDRVVQKVGRYRFAVLVPGSWDAATTQAFLTGRGWDVSSIGAPPPDVAAVLAGITVQGLPSPTGWWVMGTWAGPDNTALPKTDGLLTYATLDIQTAVPPGDAPLGAPPPAPSKLPAVLAFLGGGIVVATAIAVVRSGRGMRRAVAMENPVSLSRCVGCGIKKRASGSYCQKCKSAVHHAIRRIEDESLIVDTAGGAWWVWTAKGEVLVVGKDTKPDAIYDLAMGDSSTTENPIGNKIHIGRRGSGSDPVCSHRASRTSQLTMGVIDFSKQPVEDRCSRCEAKMPTLLRMALKKDAPSENPVRHSHRLTPDVLPYVGYGMMTKSEYDAHMRILRRVRDHGAKGATAVDVFGDNDQYATGDREYQAGMAIVRGGLVKEDRDWRFRLTPYGRVYLEQRS